MELLDDTGHVAHDLLAFAGQVADEPGSAYLPFDLIIHADAPPRYVLQVVIACGRLPSSGWLRADLTLAHGTGGD
jgi:hypothetical protein